MLCSGSPGARSILPWASARFSCFPPVIGFSSAHLSSFLPWPMLLLPWSASTMDGSATGAEGERQARARLPFFWLPFCARPWPCWGRGFIVLSLDLLIPLGSFVLLDTYLGMDSSTLAASLGVAVGLLTAAFCSRHWILRRSTVVRAIFLTILGRAFTAVVRLFFLVLSLVAYGVFFSREAVQGRGKT